MTKQIHFDFILDAKEAEALFSCVRIAMGRYDDEITRINCFPDKQSKESLATIKWCEEHISVLRNLLTKLRNNQI